MVIFVYDVCPALILAAILREVLQFAMGVHILVLNFHLYMSVVKSLLSSSVEARVCASLMIGNEVCCLQHMVLLWIKCINLD